MTTAEIMDRMNAARFENAIELTKQQLTASKQLCQGNAEPGGVAMLIAVNLLSETLLDATYELNTINTYLDYIAASRCWD